MRDCPRCGFMNPDKADYCIKCRFNIGEGAPPLGPPPAKGPVAEEVPTGPVRKTGPPVPGPKTGPPPGLAPGTRPPPGPPASPPAGQAPIAAPHEITHSVEPDSSFDPGGYRAGGVSPGRAPSGPPPSDAHTLMMGGGGLAPGEVPPPPSLETGRRRRKGKARAPRKGARAKRAAGGGIQGLPPGAIMEEPPPGQAPFPTAPGAPAARKKAIPKPDVKAITSSLGEAVRRIGAKEVMTAVVAVMFVFCLVYVAAGGDFFASPDQGIGGRAAATMSSLSSTHVTATVTVESDARGTLSGSIQADVMGNGNFHAAYVVPSREGTVPTEMVRAGGKVYKLGGSGWVPASSIEQKIQLSPAKVFDGASGTRLVGVEPVDGVNCDHLSFRGGKSLVPGLIPSVEVGPNARAYADIWVDQQQRYVRHIRIRCEGLHQTWLGNFNLTADISISNFGAPLDIKPPI